MARLIRDQGARIIDISSCLLSKSSIIMDPPSSVPPRASEQPSIALYSRASSVATSIPWTPTPQPPERSSGLDWQLEQPFASPIGLPKRPIESIERPQASSRRIQGRQPPPNVAQREWNRIEFLLQDEDYEYEENPSLEDRAVGKGSLKEPERLILIRLCIANKEHYGDGFMTLIRAAFWRLTKIRHGTLRRTMDNLVKKWRKTFENQGSETGEELDTPEGLAMKEWIDIVNRNKTKSKRAPKAAAD